MSSFARSAPFALLALAAIVPSAAGQAAGESVPAEVAADVAADIASRWAVAPERVTVEWGRVPTAARVAEGTPVRLVGKGEDGTFVAVLEPAGGSPAAVKIRAGLADTAVVAARPLARGVTLTDGDLRPEPRLRWGPPAPGAARPAAGWVTRRAIAAGEAVTPAAAEAPRVVKAGEAVRIEWRRGPVAVVLDGVALNAASLGEPVRVRLEGRGGQRRGRASGPGAVSLDS